jgi:DNA segregation ATPase FtsK/SpoIIIE-like protein
MGKTKLIDSICTNLIVSNDPQDVSLYFIQVDKSDQVIYRQSKHTRAYADDIYKALAITNYLKAIVESRDKQLRPLIENGICENIEGFNKVYKKYKQNKFSYIYLIIDEYSSLMPSDGDKQKKAIKTEIQENMERLIQIGRYVGIYVIVGLQRSTVDKLPSFIKAMCNTVITFKVNNERSSFVAIDSNEATSLIPREFIMKTDKQIYGKTTTITPATILKYIQPTRWAKSQYTDFVYESWYTAPKEKDPIKKVSISKNKKRKEERYGETKSNELSQEELNKLLSKKTRR